MPTRRQLSQHTVSWHANAHAAATSESDMPTSKDRNTACWVAGLCRDTRRGGGVRGVCRAGRRRTGRVWGGGWGETEKFATGSHAFRFEFPPSGQHYTFHAAHKQAVGPADILIPASR